MLQPCVSFLYGKRHSEINATSAIIVARDLVRPPLGKRHSEINATSAIIVARDLVRPPLALGSFGQLFGASPVRFCHCWLELACRKLAWYPVEVCTVALRALPVLAWYPGTRLFLYLTAGLTALPTAKKVRFLDLRGHAPCK